MQQARLTHGIRGVLWHQGENDQGADGPTGGYGWETYQQYFVDMSAAWKQDYPNIQHYYVFQIWPKACTMGVNGSDNMLREVQRTLPRLYSNLSVMSTLGIKPPGRLPLSARRLRGIRPPDQPPDRAGQLRQGVRRAHHAARSQAGLLHQRQEGRDRPGVRPAHGLERCPGQPVLSGWRRRARSPRARVSGNVLTLKLTAPSTAQTITYLDSRSWSQDNLLYGENGIAALTFCEVPISIYEPAR